MQATDGVLGLRPHNIRLLGENGNSTWFCECDDPTCREQIEVRHEEGLELRDRFPRGYVIAPGHDVPGERIVHQTDRFLVVETGRPRGR